MLSALWVGLLKYSCEQATIKTDIIALMLKLTVRRKKVVSESACKVFNEWHTSIYFIFRYQTNILSSVSCYGNLAQYW